MKAWSMLTIISERGAARLPKAISGYGSVAIWHPIGRRYKVFYLGKRLVDSVLAQRLALPSRRAGNEYGTSSMGRYLGFSGIAAAGMNWASGFFAAVFRG